MVASQHFVYRLVKYQQFFYTTCPQEFHNHIYISSWQPHTLLSEPENVHQLQMKAIKYYVKF